MLYYTSQDVTVTNSLLVSLQACSGNLSYTTDDVANIGMSAELYIGADDSLASPDHESYLNYIDSAL